MVPKTTKPSLARSPARRRLGLIGVNCMRQEEPAAGLLTAGSSGDGPLMPSHAKATVGTVDLNAEFYAGAKKSWGPIINGYVLQVLKISRCL